MLAEKLGLDKQKLFDIASKSSGQCWSMTNYCPVPGPVPTSPANRDYQAGFTAAMMLKDLKLAQEAANAAGAATPLGAEAAALYRPLCRTGARRRGIFPESSTSSAALTRVSTASAPCRNPFPNCPLRCRARAATLRANSCFALTQIRGKSAPSR